MRPGLLQRGFGGSHVLLRGFHRGFVGLQAGNGFVRWPARS